MALNDFQINTNNPKYSFLGKGFTEIISFELGKTRAVRIVDREKRNEALQEMEFALSGVADEANQVQVGKLLSVRYLIYGSITDLGDALLFNLNMLDVETSEVVWSDQLMEKPSNYSYIGSYFATSIVRFIKGTGTEKVAAKEVKPEGNTDALVALSEGIAALDAGKKDEARDKLEKASQLDPESSVIASMLSKLAAVSATFKVIPERYTSYWNPAYLGSLTTDTLLTSISMGFITWGYKDTNNNQLIIRDADNLWGVGERRDLVMLGYKTPLTSSLGFGANLTVTGWQDSVVSDPDEPKDIYAQMGNQQSTYYGGIISLGISISPYLNVGFDVQGAYIIRKYYLFNLNNIGYLPTQAPVFGGTFAFLIKNRTGSLSWDGLVSWTSEPQYWYDISSESFSRFMAPLYTEQTASFAFSGGRTFFAIKQVNDLFLDRHIYYVRAMPMLETWFGNNIGIRLGAEGSAVINNEKFNPGWGGTVGISIKLNKYTLDANYTLRQRPSRSLDYLIVPESLLYISLSKNGLFKQ